MTKILVQKYKSFTTISNTNKDVSNVSRYLSNFVLFLYNTIEIRLDKNGCFRNKLMGVAKIFRSRSSSIFVWQTLNVQIMHYPFVQKLEKQYYQFLRYALCRLIKFIHLWKAKKFSNLISSNLTCSILDLSNPYF